MIIIPPFLLYGLIDPAPKIKGYTVEVTKQNWVKASKDEKQYLVGESTDHWHLFETEAGGARLKRDYPNGLKAENADVSIPKS